MRVLTSGLRLALLVAGLCGCGGDSVPECKQVISSCTQSCSISCTAPEEVACVGPAFGDYDIGPNQRCCICADPSVDYGNL